MWQIRGKKTALASLVAVLAFSLKAEGMALSELVVGGLPETEAVRIRSFLPFAEGTRFSSLEEAETLAAFAKAYLSQGEEYSGVDIEVEELGGGEIGIYIFPRASMIAGLSVFGSKMTTVPNFPLYGIGTGFAVDDREQLLGLDIPILRGLAFDALGGTSLTADGAFALSGKAGFSLKPFPFFSAYAFAGMDSYVDPASAQSSSLPADAFAQGGAKLNFQFLSALVFLGPSLEASFRQGFLDFPYSAFRGKGSLFLGPFGFLKIEGRLGVYSASGSLPALAMTKNAGTRELRIAPGGLPETGGLAFASLSCDAALPLSLSLGPVSLAFSLFGFFEASKPYIDPIELTALASGTLPGLDPAAGVGILLSLSPPFSLSFELGAGYSIATKDWAFLLRLR